MLEFTSLPPCPQRLHNLYNFSAVVEALDTDRVLELALEKIDSFDDSQCNIYHQTKYGQLLCIVARDRCRSWGQRSADHFFFCAS